MNELFIFLILCFIIFFFPFSIVKDILIVFLICLAIQHILKEVLHFIREIKKK